MRRPPPLQPFLFIFSCSFRVGFSRCCMIVSFSPKTFGTFPSNVHKLNTMFAQVTAATLVISSAASGTYRVYPYSIPSAFLSSFSQSRLSQQNPRFCRHPCCPKHRKAPSRAPATRARSKRPLTRPSSQWPCSIVQDAQSSSKSHRLQIERHECPRRQRLSRGRQ